MWILKHFQSQDLDVLILLTVCQKFLIMLVLKTLLLECNIFSGLSRTWSLFPGLSSPGKCHNKIPGLSRFSSACTFLGDVSQVNATVKWSEIAHDVLLRLNFISFLYTHKRLITSFSLFNIFHPAPIADIPLISDK